MAIDSSIWLYEFQHALRDKDGRALDNAHILGFLRRINKLLYYGIKAVSRSPPVSQHGARQMLRSHLPAPRSLSLMAELPRSRSGPLQTERTANREPRSRQLERPRSS